MRYIILALLLVGCTEKQDVNTAATWTKEEQCQVWNKYNDNGKLGICDDDSVLRVYKWN